MMRKTNEGCRKLTLGQTARFLKNHNNYVILTHASPDGDTLGSAYALYYALNEIGKVAEVICPDVIPKKYDYFARKTDHIENENPTIIAVDVADSRLLGALEEEFGGKVDLCIDHHISNTKYAKNLYLDDDAAACAECIFELIGKMRVNLNDITAKAIYTGLATDTGCFKYSTVTKKTLLICAALYDYNINAAEINRLMFDTKSKKLIELESMVLNSAEFHFDDRCMVLTVTDEMQYKTGCSGTDLEGIAVISRSVEGVIAGVTLKQTGDDEFKVSLRTYSPLDASEICKTLGGGGHKGAAGASVKGDLATVKAKVLDAVKRNLDAI
ncbi:MAG: DHH family phosphoesterase [Clostridia bacterium]|nr:DHH family phosphoesterase [Clostridia bacterium]